MAGGSESGLPWLCLGLCVSEFGLLALLKNFTCCKFKFGLVCPGVTCLPPSGPAGGRTWSDLAGQSAASSPRPEFVWSDWEQMHTEIISNLRASLHFIFFVFLCLFFLWEDIFWDYFVIYKPSLTLASKFRGVRCSQALKKQRDCTTGGCLKVAGSKNKEKWDPNTVRTPPNCQVLLFQRLRIKMLLSPVLIYWEQSVQQCEDLLSDFYFPRRCRLWICEVYELPGDSESWQSLQMLLPSLIKQP